MVKKHIKQKVQCKNYLGQDFEHGHRLTYMVCLGNSSCITKHGSVIIYSSLALSLSRLIVSNITVAQV